MRRLLVSGIALAITTLAACSKDSTSPSDSSNADDYALVMFGQSGAALQGTLGDQGGHPPFDGRTGAPHLPDSLALTDAQKAEIAQLRSDFEAAHQSELAQLKSIFEQARAAHEVGATREEIRAILEQGRTIGESLRPDVEALHTAIAGVLTDEQTAWLEAHRPPMPPDVGGRRQGPPPGGGHHRGPPPPPPGG